MKIAPTTAFGFSGNTPNQEFRQQLAEQTAINNEIFAERDRQHNEDMLRAANYKQIQDAEESLREHPDGFYRLTTSQYEMYRPQLWENWRVQQRWGVTPHEYMNYVENMGSEGYLVDVRIVPSGRVNGRDVAEDINKKIRYNENGESY